MKKSYVKPTMSKIGSFESVTKGFTFGLAFDGTFNLALPGDGTGPNPMS